MWQTVRSYDTVITTRSQRSLSFHIVGITFNIDSLFFYFFFCYTSENMELGRLSVHIYLEYVIG